MSFELTITLCIYAITLFIAYHAGKSAQERQVAPLIQSLTNLIREADNIMTSQQQNINMLEHTIRELVLNPNIPPSNEIKMYFATVRKERKANEKPKSDNVVDFKKE